MAHQVLSHQQGCRLLPVLQPVGARHRVACIPPRRRSVAPCAGYGRHGDEYYRPYRSFWNQAASGLMSTTIAELLQQFEKDLGVVVETKQEGGKTTYKAKPAAGMGASAGSTRVLMDSQETEDDIVYYLDVPGLEKKDIKIQVNQQERTLTVSGERFQPVSAQEDSADSKTINKYERLFGKFSRTVTLPESADCQLISAKVDKGVLRIKVLKQIKQEPDIQEVQID